MSVSPRFLAKFQDSISFSIIVFCVSSGSVIYIISINVCVYCTMLCDRVFWFWIGPMRLKILHEVQPFGKFGRCLWIFIGLTRTLDVGKLGSSMGFQWIKKVPKTACFSLETKT